MTRQDPNISPASDGSSSGQPSTPKGAQTASVSSNSTPLTPAVNLTGSPEFSASVSQPSLSDQDGMNALPAPPKGNKYDAGQLSDNEQVQPRPKRKRTAPVVFKKGRFTETLSYGPEPTTISVESATAFAQQRIEQINKQEFKGLETATGSDARKTSTAVTRVTSATSINPNQRWQELLERNKTVAKAVSDLKQLMFNPTARAEISYTKTFYHIITKEIKQTEDEIDKLSQEEHATPAGQLQKIRLTIDQKERKLAHLQAQEIPGLQAVMMRFRSVPQVDRVIEALARLPDSNDVATLDGDSAVSTEAEDSVPYDIEAGGRAKRGTHSVHSKPANREVHVSPNYASKVSNASPIDQLEELQDQDVEARQMSQGLEDMQVLDKIDAGGKDDDFSLLP